MDQRMLSALSRIIVGRNGRRLPSYANIKQAYIKGLFADYYCYNPHVSIKTIYKYANATIPYPHFLICHYGGANSYRRTLSDMMGLVDNCPSLTLLRRIQDEVFRWILTYLPGDEAAKVCKNYVDQDATRRDIAVYLADTMHHAIMRDPVANRPSEMYGQL